MVIARCTRGEEEAAVEVVALSGPTLGVFGLAGIPRAAGLTILAIRRTLTDCGLPEPGANVGLGGATRGVIEVRRSKEAVVIKFLFNRFYYIILYLKLNILSS
jgi:hypothetical protein